MELIDILTPDRCFCKIQGVSKKRVLKTLSTTLGKSFRNLDETQFHSQSRCYRVAREPLLNQRLAFHRGFERTSQESCSKSLKAFFYWLLESCKSIYRGWGYLLIPYKTVSLFWSRTSLFNSQFSRFLSLDGGIESDSRYFAIVRRATLIPFASKICVILLSLRGLWIFSSATILLMIARIAVDENSPPSWVETWLEKKYLSSNYEFYINHLW